MPTAAESSTDTTPRRNAPTSAGPALTLAIGARSYSVSLQYWRGECHVIRLRDLATGQVTTVVDLDNIGRGRRLDMKASCSCSPGKVAVECRHVRALRALHLLPNWTVDED